MNGIEILLQNGAVEIPPQLRNAYLGCGYGWAEFDLDGRMRDFAYADHFEERLSCNQNTDVIDEDESPCAGRVWDMGDGCQIFGHFNGDKSGELFGDIDDSERRAGPHFHVNDYRGAQHEIEDVLKLFRLRNDRFGWAVEEKIKKRLIKSFRYACGSCDGALQKFCMDALAVYERHGVCSHIPWNLQWCREHCSTARPPKSKNMCRQSFVRLHERARKKRNAEEESFYRDLLLVYKKNGF